MVSDARVAEIRQVQRAVVAWAEQRSDIEGVAIVGSWARSTARNDSDIDLVVLTQRKDEYIVDDAWVHDAVGQTVSIVRTQVWGPLTERRVRLASGLEVEFGFATPEWAAIDPLDDGTARVIRDGCIPLIDRRRYFAQLIAAV